MSKEDLVTRIAALDILLTKVNSAHTYSIGTEFFDDVEVLQARVFHARNRLKKEMDTCAECKVEHVENKVCECGACMYAYCKQIPDDMYPIFECTKCGQRHFWD